MDSTPLKLPDEILVKIFEYLPVKDITSCRLMCQKWYSCCDVRSIRKNEIYVFRAGLLTSTEINDILVNHRATQISVEFVRVELDQLRFNEFGAKIQALEINECFCDSLTNIFLCTPNMKCFIYRYLNDFSTGKQERQLRDLTIDFHKNGGVIRNLEKLECFSRNFGAYDTLDLFSEPFACIFPSLTSIRLPSKLQNLNETLKCLLIQNNVTELGNVSFPPLDYSDENIDLLLCLQYDTIKSLPRFTKLEITIDYTFDLCFELFSQQSCLKTLKINLTDLQKNSSSRKFETQLLLHVLENCKRLTTLHFYLVDGKCLHLNNTDIQLFEKIIAASKPIIDLVMPPITIDGSTQASFFTLFSGLKYLGMERIIYYKTQFLNFSPSVLCEDVMEIINSQKSLERLKFQTVWKCCEKVPDVDNTLKVGQLRSDKLKHLELNFQVWNFTNVQTLMSWRFPNLSTLKLEGIRDSFDPHCDLDYTNRFIDWIQSMPSLKTIFLGWFTLNDDQSVSICSKLPNLEFIAYKAVELSSQSMIKSMFANRQTLRKVVVKVDRIMYEYHYAINRSKNIVYFREGTMKPYEFYTSMT